MLYFWTTKCTTTTIFLGICLLVCGSVLAKEKVTKQRDKLRFGYGTVKSTVVKNTDVDGNVTIEAIEIQCFNKGLMKCRASGIANSGATNELDVFSEEFTLAERAVAERVLLDGDGQITGGSLSGRTSEVMQFVNTENGTSYFRKFSYVWITNEDGSISSALDVSDQY